MMIHFAHANGIPGASYVPIFKRLPTHSVFFKPKFGHDKRFPCHDNWQYLADELIDHVRQHATEPVVAVGHSCGALLSWIAACKSPHLFSGVLLLDPPLVWGRYALMFKMAKWIKKTDAMTPAGKSKKRRTVWSSFDEAKAYFASKSLFQFESECFDAFIEHALRHYADCSVELDFDVAVEVDIFRNTPDNLHQYCRPAIPIRVVYADKSYASRPEFIIPFSQHYDVDLVKIAGEHMYPLQQPDMTAQLIRTFIKDFNL